MDQGRRVALARALVMNPRVLLLDEPLGAHPARAPTRGLDIAVGLR